MYTYLSSNWLQENDATHPTYLSGPMDTQKSRYSSPVDHRSLDDLCTSTYTMSQKLCARYTLGVRQLYFKRNVEKFGVRVIGQERVIGRKIRYIFSLSSQSLKMAARSQNMQLCSVKCSYNIVVLDYIIKSNPITGLDRP